MIPETLDGWTLEVVRALVEQGVFETDCFDFKEMLPHSKDEDGKRRLRRDVPAFANSDGGFLIFGVKDDKGIRTEDRIVGLPSAHDFPEHFGSYASASEPSVEWSFRNPGIALTTERVVHVVRVPQSQRRPHGLFEDHRWWFPKRTNKGTEPMTYEEVRLAFQDTETRRTKLALLSSELSNIDWVAERLLREVPEQASADGLVLDWAWMTRYPTALVDTILGDAFSLMADKTDLWAALAMLRDETRRSNAVADMYSNYGFVRSTADRQQRTKLYGLMRESAMTIRQCIRHAKRMVDAVLSGGYGKLLDTAEAKP